MYIIFTSKQATFTETLFVTKTYARTCISICCKCTSKAIQQISKSTRKLAPAHAEVDGDASHPLPRETAKWKKENGIGACARFFRYDCSMLPWFARARAQKQISQIENIHLLEFRNNPTANGRHLRVERRCVAQCIYTHTCLNAACVRQT